MDYLLTSVFEIQDGRSWHKYLVTRDRNGTTWYRRLDWIEPAGNDIDLTVLGDEI
jgi:hypothetical protein